MPIEVRELVIKAIMEEERGGQLNTSKGAMVDFELKQQAKMERFKKETIKECLDMVKKLLERQKKR